MYRRLPDEYIVFSYQAVRDVELEYLFENWNELGTSKELVATIEAVVRGEYPHASAVLIALFSRSSELQSKS